MTNKSLGAGAPPRVLVAAAAALLVVSATAIASGGGSAGSAAPAALPAVTLTQLPGSLTDPIHVTNAHDGSDRLFVVQRGGVIKVFKDGAFLPTPFLDIHTLITCCDERGLLSMAFHPDYSSNGYFYVYYVNNLTSPGDITIARYTVSSGNPDVADPNSAVVLLVIPHPTNTNHYGGQLFFGPTDHYLYIGTGDGGSGGDPPNNAQNLAVLLGKILRIDVDGTGAVPCGQADPMPYAIPASNPFAGDMTDCNEIWAYGVRNPFRYSFDRATSDLWIGDVGQNCYEEVDLQPASSTGGVNYGWRVMEGMHCYNTDGTCNPVSCNQTGLTLPILEETHTNGWCALIGGYRYRGTAIPGLAGKYLYSDNCLGDIYAASDAGGGNWTRSLLLSTTLSVDSFGEDEEGELYVVDLNGSVSRLDPVPLPPPVVTIMVPSTVIAGDPDFSVVVNGSGFVATSVVQWNGSARPTTFLSSNQLRATIAAADIATPGMASVTVFTPAPGGGTSSALTMDINATFLDVPTDYFAYAYIEAIFDAGVTAGCDVRLFCPEGQTTRAQMAVFLLKASQAPGYAPPPCSGMVFADVPCTGNPFDPWIEDLASRGITGGCGGGNYCPSANVTRAQMSAFLLKTEHGSAYVPPTCGGTFTDVPCPSLFADWIEQLALEGITAGCGGTNYCPGDPSTRAQMAVFLTKTFNLPLP
ncbi:MAG TPA: PQQ-dependent sugar dehydrogenase [Thermoanaerobaculia bacterium]|nr:PQQ-dependent sugar dehydrogenase [Thermoanaerobaculia bacterium]